MPWSPRTGSKYDRACNAARTNVAVATLYLSPSLAVLVPLLLTLNGRVVGEIAKCAATCTIWRSG